jgi:hypothetical protein
MVIQLLIILKVSLMPSFDTVPMIKNYMPLSKLSNNGIIICWVQGDSLAHQSSSFDFLEHTNKTTRAVAHQMGILHSTISFGNKIQEG